MSYADIPGARLWFKETGRHGTPVVFLHAASGTSDSWGLQEPAFIEAGYRCIAYDRKNWGRSESVTPAGSAADDLEALTQHLGLNRFHMVCTALGGIIGLDYTVEYPDRVISLTVSSSFTGVTDQSYLDVQTRLHQRSPTYPSSCGRWVRPIGPSTPRAWPSGCASRNPAVMRSLQRKASRPVAP